MGVRPLAAVGKDRTVLCADKHFLGCVHDSDRVSLILSPAICVTSYISSGWPCNELPEARSPALSSSYDCCSFAILDSVLEIL